MKLQERFFIQLAKRVVLCILRYYPTKLRKRCSWKKGFTSYFRKSIWYSRQISHLILRPSVLILKDLLCFFMLNKDVVVVSSFKIKRNYSDNRENNCLIKHISQQCNRHYRKKEILCVDYSVAKNISSKKNIMYCIIQHNNKKIFPDEIADKRLS